MVLDIKGIPTIFKKSRELGEGFSGDITQIIIKDYGQGNFVIRQEQDLPVTFDFVVGDFTTDASWHDLDLSGIIPEGAKAVLIKMTTYQGSVGTKFLMKKKGTIDGNCIDTETQVNLRDERAQGIIGVDENRKVQYWGSNNVWGYINIIIMGWFI